MLNEDQAPRRGGVRAGAGRKAKASVVIPLRVPSALCASIVARATAMGTNRHRWILGLIEAELKAQTSRTSENITEGE